MKTVEAYMKENLAGEAMETALAFAQYLRECGIEFEKDEGFWRDKIYFMLRFRTDYVGFISIRDPDEPENLWTVWSDGEESHWYADANPDGAVLACGISHIDYCGHCGSCPGGKPRRIFCREYDDVCGTTFRIDNPGADDLPFMKYMIRMRREEILARG